MRVLLIQPPEGGARALRALFRPLSLELLAAYLGGHQVEIHDLRVDDTPLDQVLSRFGPELIGVSCSMTCAVPSTRHLVAELKRLRPGTPVVLGGVHVSLLPDDVDGADAVVVGPGEVALPALVAALGEGRPLEQVPGIYLRQGERLVHTGQPDRPYSLRDFRHPARHLTRKYRDRYPLSPRGQTTSLTVTSRGCPHRCSFCAAWKVQGGKVVVREVEDLLAEIRQIEEELVYFFDDNSFASVRRMKELARRLKEERVDKSFQLWASADRIAGHEDLVRAWSEAGLRRVFVGFESCSDEQLRRYGKRASVEMNEEAHRLLQRHGIELSPTFIVRHDYTASDFEQLHEYLLSRRFTMPYPLIYTPLPGTELWERHRDELCTTDYERFDLLHLTLRPQHLPARELMRRFSALYLENPSWRAVAAVAPAAAGILEGIAALPADHPE
jgi:radical SAM superfamily enzyme YgiQ (UPF0313 family)